MLKSRSGAVKINDVKVDIDLKSNGGQVVLLDRFTQNTRNCMSG